MKVNNSCMNELIYGVNHPAGHFTSLVFYSIAQISVCRQLVRLKIFNCKVDQVGILGFTKKLFIVVVTKECKPTLFDIQGAIEKKPKVFFYRQIRQKQSFT